MKLRQFESSDLMAVSRLFDLYPYKVSQRVVQKLDRARLNALYLSGLQKSFEAGEKIFVAERDGEVVACAGLAPDKWHSEIYGMKMGKLQPWLNFISPEAGAPLRDALLAEARQQAYQHISIRVDGEEFSQLHLFESVEFHLIDISLKFSRPMPFAPNMLPSAREGWRVRLSTPQDAIWMRELGSKTHAHTHFLNDPHLPREKTQALFDAWVVKCIEKLAYRIYVLEDNEGTGRGFVIYLRNNSMKQTVGVYPIILDYVILAPEARGGGVGPWFVQESLKQEAESGFDYCELRTSAHNHAAIGCYEKLGFRICATDMVLHGKI